jgi:hypothetical protein
MMRKLTMIKYRHLDRDASGLFNPGQERVTGLGKKSTSPRSGKHESVAFGEIL